MDHILWDMQNHSIYILWYHLYLLMVYNQQDMYLHIRLQITNDLGLDILILIYILLPRLGDI